MCYPAAGVGIGAPDILVALSPQLVRVCDEHNHKSTRKQNPPYCLVFAPDIEHAWRRWVISLPILAHQFAPCPTCLAGCSLRIGSRYDSSNFGALQSDFANSHRFLLHGESPPKGPSLPATWVRHRHLCFVMFYAQNIRSSNFDGRERTQVRPVRIVQQKEFGILNILSDSDTRAAELRSSRYKRVIVAPSPLNARTNSNLLHISSLGIS